MNANPIDLDSFAARDGALRLLDDLTDEKRRTLAATRVTVCGMGNIGSWIPEFLACFVRSIVLIDRDRVDASRNRSNQFYRASDDGRPKADVLADRLRERWPNANVTAHVADLNDVPWSEFARADLILAGLDSLKGRQQLINERAWPLGKTVIDGAVGFRLLGRVQVIRPGEATGCVECNWQGAHYRLAALSDPCNPANASDTPPTRSPAFLGAAVAGVMVAEAAQLLIGERDQESRQIDINLSLPRWTVARMQRAGGCRFDHERITDRRMMPGGFATATVDALREWIQTEFAEDSTVTFSRPFARDAFGPVTTATFRELANWRGRHVSDLGCTPGDWLVVRNEEQRAFLLLEPLERPETEGEAP
jgi:ThiF family